MILGLDIPQFTALHVAISLIGIASGLAALITLAGGRFHSWTHTLFLVTTLLTSLTGFLFPISGFTPALGVGVISTLVLAVALAALFVYGRRGRARVVYAVTATVALWLNMFVLVAQSFLKVPALNALAPTGSEPPFLAAQALLLIAMLALGVATSRTRRPLPS